MNLFLLLLIAGMAFVFRLTVKRLDENNRFILKKLAEQLEMIKKVYKSNNINEV